MIDEKNCDNCEKKYGMIDYCGEQRYIDGVCTGWEQEKEIDIGDTVKFVNTRSHIDGMVGKVVEYSYETDEYCVDVNGEMWWTDIDRLAPLLPSEVKVEESDKIWSLQWCNYCQTPIGRVLIERDTPIHNVICNDCEQRLIERGDNL